MIKYFLSFSVRKQIIALLGFMGVIILVFSGGVIFDNWSKYSENKELADFVEFSIKASDLVHEIQKEREMTASFTKSKGQKFSTELPAQRKKTNEKRDIVLRYLKNLHVDAGHVKFNESLMDMVKVLGHLTETRQGVDALSISAGKVIGFYTRINTDVLNAISDIQHYSHDSEILLQLSAYINFLQGKEKAGIERAVGAGGFTTGFNSQNITKFNKLITIQETYFSVFKGVTSPANLAFFNAALSSEAVKEVARMRDIAYLAVESGDFQGVTADYWFKQITAKIDSLKQIEDKVATHLFEDVLHKEYAALYLLLAISLLTLLAFSGVVYFGMNFTNELDACFSALKRALTKGSEGILNYRIEDINSQGEMKDVQDCTNDFMTQTNLFVDSAASCMGALAREDYSQKVPVTSLKGRFSESADAMNAAVKVSGDQARALGGLMGELEKTVKSVIEDTAKLAGKMKDSSATMLSMSNDSVEKSAEVDRAASTSQEGAVSVASAVEELSASIGQISTQAEQSNKVVSKTQDEVTAVIKVVESFATDVDNIGHVVELINDIAEQTNLLALNATIESARAGEAGKGFAVVASEVKNLAGQTAKATEEIVEKIGSIQSGSEKISAGIKSIGETMGEVFEISNEITSSVEEQNAATQEISTNMQRTSDNVNDVKENIGDIKTSLEENVSSASSILAMTDDLRTNVDRIGDALDSVLKKQA